MRRSDIVGDPGTAEYVVSHSRYMASRGKRPSQPYLTERNPFKALENAKRILTAKGRTEEMLGLLEDWVEGGHHAALPFDEMDDTQLEVAAKGIARTSSSEEEFRRRLSDELDYPYADSVAIHSSVPTDRVGREARDLVLALGGLTMKNGAIVMVMMHGHEGVIQF